MKHMLVTGGAGFIGANFIEYILRTYDDYRVTNLDSLTYAGNIDNLALVEKQYNDRYVFVKGDIVDESTVDPLVEQADVVVHFAAETHVDTSIENPDIFLTTNILGTHTLLKAALKYGKKRFHHVSTDEVFGALPLGGGLFSEKTPYDPRSPYSASKASSDHLVQAYFHTHDLPTTISNCSNNYGPYQFPEKIIPLFILSALQDKELPIYGDGKSVRDYLFVEDHCRAIDMIVHDGVPGESYCVGGGAEKNGIEIADTILNILGKPDTLKKFVSDRLGHDRRYAIDNEKMRNTFHWQPVMTFEEGLKQTINWYKEHPEWWQKLI